MALTQPQQIFETIKRSSYPLLVVSAKAGADGYSTALGLSRVLKKLNKTPDIVAVDGSSPKEIQFIENHGEVNTELRDLRKLVIEIDTTKTQIHRIDQDEKDGRFFVSITPKKGFWADRDIQTTTSAYKYDLLICIGANGLEDCAHFYRENSDFFFRTPIINIGHSTANEHFGQINAVDLTACSCGEVCYDLIEKHEDGLIDAEVATAFLTGMIAKTRSFKTKDVTPKTLQTASKLMKKGARRDEIIYNLYRTRSVTTLRLWGRALARLKHDPKTQAVWTLLSQQDFMHSGAEENDLPGVIDELISSSPDAKKIILIYEDSDKNICVILRVEPPFDALEIASNMKPAGTREEVRMCFIGKNLVQVEKEVLAEIVNVERRV